MHKLLTAETKCKLCEKVSIKLNYQFMRREFKEIAETALFKMLQQRTQRQ